MGLMKNFFLLFFTAISINCSAQLPKKFLRPIQAKKFYFNDTVFFFARNDSIFHIVGEDTLILMSTSQSSSVGSEFNLSDSNTFTGPVLMDNVLYLNDSVYLLGYSSPTETGWLKFDSASRAVKIDEWFPALYGMKMNFVSATKRLNDTIAGDLVFYDCGKDGKIIKIYSFEKTTPRQAVKILKASQELITRQLSYVEKLLKAVYIIIILLIAYLVINRFIKK